MKQNVFQPALWKNAEHHVPVFMAILNLLYQYEQIVYNILILSIQNDTKNYLLYRLDFTV